MKLKLSIGIIVSLLLAVGIISFTPAKVGNVGLLAQTAPDCKYRPCD
jgi:hypothetical protein